MKRYDLLTPEGTRDQLFDECIAKRTIQEKLNAGNQFTDLYEQILIEKL